jgi:hypothetical protein
MEGAMETQEKKQAAPPYVAYKTLSNFLDRFKQGVPGRIDRGLMGSMSGAAQSQVTTALRYLGMISENGIPQERMRRYVNGEESERRGVLKEILEDSYPFIFKGDFDLATATASMLRENLETNTSATGETLSRCIAFLKDAAAGAGIPVSRYIVQKKGRPAVAKKRVPPQKREEPEKAKLEAATAHSMPHRPLTMPATASMLLTGLFQRLPVPGKPWPKTDREQWLQTLQNVLLMEYPES